MKKIYKVGQKFIVAEGDYKGQCITILSVDNSVIVYEFEDWHAGEDSIASFEKNFIEVGFETLETLFNEKINDKIETLSSAIVALQEDQKKIKEPIILSNTLNELAFKWYKLLIKKTDILQKELNFWKWRSIMVIRGFIVVNFILLRLSK